ncbi:MAG: TIM barrel protein [Candidatus Aenigmatarchaeota archaeon]
MAKVKLGPAGIPLSARGMTSVDGVRKVKELGLQAMEIEFVRGVGMKNPTAKELGKVAKELKIELSIHAPYYINLSSMERIKIRQSMKRILDSCERGHHMGAKIVVFHPGYFGKFSKEKVEEMIVHACQEMSDKIKGNGWKVLLGPETTGKHSAFGSLEETIRLCRKVKGCKPVVDFAHLYARAMGNIDFGKVLSAVRAFGHLHSHFSCINYTEKGERNHMILAAKKPDFRAVAGEILKKKMDITIISESPILEKDSLKMKKVFENLGYKKW